MNLTLPTRAIVAGAVAVVLGLGAGACSARPSAASGHASEVAASHEAGHPYLRGRPVVAFVGDSYSSGAAASSLDARWTTHMCARERWNEVNVAIPGMGYVAGEPSRDYSAQITKLASTHPALLVISGGWNDVAHGYSTGRILDGLRRTLRAAKTALPGVPVVVIAPIGPASAPSPALEGLRREAAAVVRADGARYVDLNFPLMGHPEWISSDGLHPDDAGYAKLAGLTAPAIRAALGDH